MHAHPHRSLPSPTPTHPHPPHRQAITIIGFKSSAGDTVWPSWYGAECLDIECIKTRTAAAFWDGDLSVNGLFQDSSDGFGFYRPDEVRNTLGCGV
jgi:hypothetical protein